MCFRPEGAVTYQPGKTYWEQAATIVEPCKGRKVDGNKPDVRSVYRPFVIRTSGISPLIEKAVGI